MESTTPQLFLRSVVQAMNAFLHITPVAILAYGVYWSFFFLFFTPIVVFVLQIQTLWKLYQYMKNANPTTAYAPNQHPNKQLAIVITGCDSGFGKGLAIRAADAGYTVFAGYLSKKSATEDKEFASCPTLIPLQMDVTDDNQVAKAVQMVDEWLHDADTTSSSAAATEKQQPTKQRILHAVVNNAGVGYGGDIDWLEVKDFQLLMDVNYIGVVRVCKAFLSLLKTQSIQSKHDGGRILNLSSAAGKCPASPYIGAYSASKHACTIFSSALRMDLKHFNVQVSTVAPSFHATPMANGVGSRNLLFFDGLDQKKKDQYGPEYREHIQSHADRINRISWDPSMVVDQMFTTLTVAKCEEELFIGTDCRFVLLALRLLPAWLAELITEHEYQARPVPAAMKNKKQ